MKKDVLLRVVTLVLILFCVSISLGGECDMTECDSDDPVVATEGPDPGDLTKWQPENPVWEENGLYGVCAFDTNDVIAVGMNLVLHYDGSEWKSESLPAVEGFRRLNGVWGSSPDDVYAVGERGVFHNDGTGWSKVGPEGNFYAVWGSDADDVFLGGAPGVVHFDGTTWANMNASVTDIRGMWGASGNDVFAVGVGGTIVHYDGASWSSMTSGVVQNLFGVWGSSGNDVFAVGSEGTIVHYDGSNWQTQVSVTDQGLKGVWGSSSSDVYAVGGIGTILSYNGSDWAVGASWISDLVNITAIDGTSASHAVVVGWTRKKAGTGGSIIQFDGFQWNNKNFITSVTLEDVWGTSANDVHAVGDRGVILHKNAGGWSKVPTPAIQNSHYRGVCGTSPTDVYAVGSKGRWANEALIAHYDGGTWTEVAAPPSTRTLHDVWVVDPDTVFAVGNFGTILIMAGASWQPMTSTTTDNLVAVWGLNPRAVYAVGNNTVVVFNGTEWTNIAFNPARTVYTSIHGREVTGTTSGEHYVLVGEVDGSVGDYHSWDSTYKEWQVSSMAIQGVWSAKVSYAVGASYNIWLLSRGWYGSGTGTNGGFKGVWSTADGEVFVVGNEGVIVSTTGPP